ncbi:YaiI/YqxD family protein [Spirochaetota bacterium]
MTIWADADSLPREVKDLIGRRAGSSNSTFPIRAVFVANRPLPLPPGKNLQAVIVGPAGASVIAHGAKGASTATDWDNADDYIMAAAVPGDILVTRDIPLAARAVSQGLVALNDRGTLWSSDSVRERVSVRDHMTSLRERGIAPASSRSRGFGPKDVKAFADALDKAIRASIVDQRT